MKVVIIILTFYLTGFLSFAQKGKQVSAVPVTVTNAGRVVLVIKEGIKENNPVFAEKTFLPGILYEVATRGRKAFPRITTYKDSSLTKTYTIEETLKRGEFEENIQVPLNPDDPNSWLKDSVIVNPFEPQSINMLILLADSICYSPGDSFQYKITAIALIKNRTKDGIIFSFHPLFWLKWEDILPVLKAEPFLSAANADGRLKFSDYFDKKMYKAVSPATDYFLGKETE